MREVLQKLVRTQGVRGALVASPDGLVAAAETAGDVDDEAVAAAAAAMWGASAAAALRLGRGAISRCALTGEAGGAILAGAGGERVEGGNGGGGLGAPILVALLKPDANQGLVLVEVKSAAAEVAKRAAF